MNRAALMQRIEQHFAPRGLARGADLAVLLEDICCQVYEWGQEDAVAEQAESEKSDAVRLDFLDLNSDYGMGWRVGVAPAGNISAQVIIGSRTTIREAIDTAMRTAAVKEVVNG